MVIAVFGISVGSTGIWLYALTRSILEKIFLYDFLKYIILYGCIIKLTHQHVQFMYIYIKKYMCHNQLFAIICLDPIKEH